MQTLGPTASPRFPFAPSLLPRPLTALYHLRFAIYYSAGMEIVNRIPRMMSIARDLRTKGRKIGFVPTMGAIHEGHMSLMTRAREMSDIVVVSTFVDPMQFSSNDEFDKYPRDLAHDAELAFTRGVDLIFAPVAADVYQNGFASYVVVEGLSNKLEGSSRPEFFRGVATVMSKLFNIVRPQFAFFSRKHAQEIVVIKRVVRDLSVDVEIVTCPTVREEDGLALSSKNWLLSTEERKAATVLRRALERCRTMYNGGERDASRVLLAMRQILEAEPLARIDYVAITDIEHLEHLDIIPASSPTLISMAVYIGPHRLTDNIMLNGDL